MDKATYGVRDAAAALGITPDAVRHAIIRGHLEATKVHGAYVVTDAALGRYLARRPRAHDAERSAYRSVAAYIGGGDGDDVDDATLSLARAYAKRRRRAWPPR